MSYLALELLQSIEHSKTSARFMFSGKHGHAELWIEEGEIKQVEGCPIESLRKLLLQSPVEVWVRPLEEFALRANNTPRLSIKDLAFEAAAYHDSGKQELASNRNQDINNLSIPATHEVASQPAVVWSDNNPTKTASYPLSKIANGFDSGTINKAVENSAVKTAAYRTILFNKGNPDKKIIGRSSRCDVILVGKEISGRHCVMEFDGSHLKVSDLDSTNGSFLNGALITNTVRADSNDVLSLGGSTFIILIE